MRVRGGGQWEGERKEWDNPYTALLSAARGLSPTPSPRPPPFRCLVTHQLVMVSQPSVRHGLPAMSTAWSTLLWPCPALPSPWLPPPP